MTPPTTNHTWQGNQGKRGPWLNSSLAAEHHTDSLHGNLETGTEDREGEGERGSIMSNGLHGSMGATPTAFSGIASYSWEEASKLTSTQLSVFYYRGLAHSLSFSFVFGLKLCHVFCQDMLGYGIDCHFSFCCYYGGLDLFSFECREQVRMDVHDEGRQKVLNQRLAQTSCCIGLAVGIIDNTRSEYRQIQKAKSLERGYTQKRKHINSLVQPS